MLKVPDELSGVGIQRERGIEVEGVVREPFVRRPQRAGVVGIARAEDREVVHRVVAPRNPDRSAIALLDGQPIPTVAARLGGTRDGVEPPGFLSRLRVERHDVISALEATGRADHHLSSGHQGATRQLLSRKESDTGSERRITHHAIPDDASGPGIERNDMGVGRRHIETSPVDRDAPLDARRHA